MKATLKLATPAFTGRMKDVDIVYHPEINTYVVRKPRRIPSHIPDNTDVKAAFAFARRIELSQGFHQDCKRYIKSYNKRYSRTRKSLNSWPPIWLKMMKAQIKADPTLDLETLSREDLITNEIPCRSLSTAIQAGFLDSVPGHKEMVSLV